MSTFFAALFLVCGVPEDEFGPVTGCYKQSSITLFATAEECQSWLQAGTVPGRTFYGYAGGVVTDKACVQLQAG